VDGEGVHAARFEPALVDALDALFAGGDAAQAALVARVVGGVA
jgi:exodeoxyribonuclease V beta subunit